MGYLPNRVRTATGYLRDFPGVGGNQHSQIPSDRVRVNLFDIANDLAATMSMVSRTLQVGVRPRS